MIKHTYTYSRKRVLHDSTTELSNKRVKLSPSDTEEDRDTPEMKASPKRIPKSPGSVQKTKHLSSRLFNPSATSTPKNTASKRGKTTAAKGSASKPKLTQMHLNIGNTSLRTCPLCDLSYTRGTPDDESIHRSHCARIQRGMDWGKEMEKDEDVIDIRREVLLKDGKTRGRIISVRGDIGGKVGSKMTTLLSTIDLALSSPPLTRDILKQCKIYMFLLPSSSPSGGTKEKIAGCVVAQRITKARELEVVSPNDQSKYNSTTSTGSLRVLPDPVPASLGVARLFVSSKCRRMGIANALLDSAAETFIHGCPLDPSNGDVAFTQPTGAGEEVMKSWGGGKVRVYEETDC